MNGSVLLEVEGLVVERDNPILTGVDWRVEAGQHWVLLGPNGSGKTSLLSSILGYLVPTAGEIRLLGHRFGRSDWREVRKRVGVVSSAVAQWIEAGETARDAVCSGEEAVLNIWRDPGRKTVARARRLLRQVGLAARENHCWWQLSQGERQRVLLARALMADPAILILDEPCAGLDPVARETLLAALDRLTRRVLPATVLVTHHVEEIGPGVTHGFILGPGRPVAAGPLRSALTTANLARAFGARVRLRQSGGRYGLAVTPQSGKIC